MVELKSDIGMELMAHTGDDAGVAAAARVSTGLDLLSYNVNQDEGLINYLMKHRHGSPFEHNLLTFRVHAPIFVFREWHRHRIGWSYNEVSGRYAKLEPVFYTYPENRPLAQAGSSAHPELVTGSWNLQQTIVETDAEVAQFCWDKYEQRLEAGAANEVARSVLPLSVYTTMYASCNVRSLMSFLSLRVDDPEATFPSKPQWEIQQGALKMEASLALLFPATYRAFSANGRVGA